MQYFYDILGSLILWMIETGDKYAGEIITAVITSIVCYFIWN